MKYPNVSKLLWMDGSADHTPAWWPNSRSTYCPGRHHVPCNAWKVAYERNAFQTGVRKKVYGCSEQLEQKCQGMFSCGEDERWDETTDCFGLYRLVRRIYHYHPCMVMLGIVYNYAKLYWVYGTSNNCLSATITQDGAPKIAKLVYKWLNYGLW